MRKILAILLATVALNSVSVSADEYIELSTPNIDSSFKTYMDYRTITSQSSDQYKYIDRWGYLIMTVLCVVMANVIWE